MMKVRFVSCLFPLLLMNACITTPDHRGTHFVAFTEFDRFEHCVDPATGRIILTSPVIRAGLDWDELIVSWNIRLPDDAGLQVEARPVYPEGPASWFILGRWSNGACGMPRASVARQSNEIGEVRTDILRLHRPCASAQIRLTLTGTGGSSAPESLFLGLCFTDTDAQSPPLSPNRAAWGMMIDVPERSQLDYAEGAQSWCSPACTSMVLAHWAHRLDRPELDRPVPEVASAVFDPNWPGTGNWPFNTAYAGSFAGMRGCVTRFSDLAEVENWVAAGIPVVLSVSYNRLKGRSTGGSGHLVVCVGFTETGDAILNDPGKSDPVRRSYPREALVRAWAESRNTVYLIHPENAAVPKDPHGHW